MTGIYNSAMLADEKPIRDLIRTIGPHATHTRLIAENDALIRSADLLCGRQLAAARTAIHTALVQDWAEELQHRLDYDRPFAVVALGGTGRAEMAPCSDTDFAFLFDDALEGNPFLLEIQRQVLHTAEFERRCGFQCQALPFSLDDIPDLEGKQLNTFIDLRPVFDPQGLTAIFRERIRATFDPFEHFLHVRSFWKEQWEKATAESERLDRFDIKNEGLRVFLAAIWTLAGAGFVHSHEIYGALDDPRDLAAYDFLLRIRAFVHSRPKTSPRTAAPGNHTEDILGFDDFLSFGELAPVDADDYDRFRFANEVRARLLSARRRIARFAIGVIERELHRGRTISPGSPIVFGVGGLSHLAAPTANTPVERSRAAMQLLLAAQHYGVAVDRAELQTTFRNAGDWLEPVPELAALFYESRGSLADTFEFLSQLDGVEANLFPGYGEFESSMDARVMIERSSLRGALERSKTRYLEQFVRDGHEMLARLARHHTAAEVDRGVAVEAEAARLDVDHLVAVKLALKTKRLPLTASDEVRRRDAGRPLHERFSSGFSEIPLASYYRNYAMHGFTTECLAVVEFLIANRRAFKDRIEAGLNDAHQVSEFAQLCGNEHRLRALFVFTCTDHAEWESQESDPASWFHSRELYTKALAQFRPQANPLGFLQAAGYGAEELQILQNFGEDFLSSNYRSYANRFGTHILRLATQPKSTPPKVSFVSYGPSTIIVVAARDYRGLAASITGALWDQGLELRQAHLFSASRYGLALDFFHLAPQQEALAADLPRHLEAAISQRRFIADSDEEVLPPIIGRATLHEWRPQQYCLRFESSGETRGLVSALTYKVYRHLRGNIFGLNAYTARQTAYVSVYHTLPRDISLEQARAIVAARIPD
ncbi:MAG: hypothetical protein KDI83_00335 [Gammaproteobacteria bacterium]|nr:hypothetical protein [Gammaproteobacteria bacterium]